MGMAANPELCLPKATAEVVAMAVQCLPRLALLASMQEEQQEEEEEEEGVGRPLALAQWRLPMCGRPTPTQAAAEEEGEEQAEVMVLVTTTKIVRLPLWAWPLFRRARRRSGNWRPLLQSRQEGGMLLQKRRHKVVVVVVCTAKAAGTSFSVEAEEAEGDISSSNNSKG
jgi:hypothetical protein